MGAIWSHSDGPANDSEPPLSQLRTLGTSDSDDMGWNNEQIDVLSEMIEVECGEGGIIDETASPIVKEEAVRRRTIDKWRPWTGSLLYGVGWDGAKPSLKRLESSADRTVKIPPIPGVPDHDYAHKAVTDTLSKHEDLFQVVTPIRPKELNTMLRSHPNRNFVKSLIDGFKNGFWPGANTSRMNSSRPMDLDPVARRPKVPEQVGFLRAQRKDEISKRRYSKSFGTKLLPGMVCTPVFTKPKPGPKKFRLINNHSAGDPSLNSMIGDNATYVQLDTLTHLAASLRRAITRHGKTPAYLFTSDVAEAYRLIPIHPRWQVRQVNRIDGELYVNRNAVFGNRGSGRLFCLFFAAVIWCAKNVLGLEDIFHYVDDSFSYDFDESLVLYPPYNQRMPKKQVALLSLFDRLGIPHEEKKQKFGKDLEIIGFVVSLTDLTISLPEGKLVHLRKMIRTFVKERAQPLKEWWELLGVANYALQVAPKLKPALYSSFDAISGKKKPSEKVHLSNEIIADLEWFSQQLGKAKPIRIMDGGPWEKSQADLVLHCGLSDGAARIMCPARNISFDTPLSSDPGPVECPEARCILLALQWATRRRPPPIRLIIVSPFQRVPHLFNKLEAPDGAHKKVLFEAIQFMVAYGTDLKVDCDPHLVMTTPTHDSSGPKPKKEAKDKGRKPSNPHKRHFGTASNYRFTTL